MTRKDELTIKARTLIEKWPGGLGHLQEAIEQALLRVERECWNKIINEIEQSGNTRLDGWKNWCRDQLKEVE